MRASTDTSNEDRLVRASYALLLVGLAVTATVVRFDLRAALLPLAVVFGWLQIGGL